MLSMRFKAFARDESGSTLVAVIGLMSVMAIVGSTIASVSAQSLQFTSSTRASVQAQASADAGIDATLANLTGSGSTCSANYNHTTAPIYSTAVSFTTATSITSATAWTTGCPTSSAKFVRVVSTGTATAKGLGDLSSGDVRKVEAIYNYSPVTTTIQGSGSASYSYSNGGINDVKLLVAGSGAADIKIKKATSTITCQTNPTTIGGSVYIGSGDFSTSNGCNITGSVYVGGSARIGSGSTVGGSVSAAGIGKSSGDAVAYLAGGKVVGNVSAAGMFTMDGGSTVGGSVVSAKLPNGSTGGASVVNPSGTKISGNLSTAGVISTWANRCPAPNNTWDDAGNACSLTAAGANVVTGTVKYNQTGLVGPTAPTVPDWVDYNYASTDWTALGFTVVTWPNNSDYCTIDNRTSTFAFAAALSTYTSPTVIDARACSKLVFSSSANLLITAKTDIAFIANGFSIEGLRVRSSSTTQHKMWFVVSDKTENSQPTCTGSTGNITVGNSTNIESTISALAYTPCAIDNSSATWSGQMYGATTSFHSSTQLTYSQVGLPRVNLDGTDTTTVTTSSTNSIGTLVSIRDVP
jgi:hypothetical protein